jgi:hypothetical protein
VALGESFVSVGVVAVFPYDDALLILVIPIIFDNSKKTENKSRVELLTPTNKVTHIVLLNCSNKTEIVLFILFSLFYKER